MSELSIERRDVEDLTLLYPAGFINAHTVRQFEGEIQGALEQNPPLSAESFERFAKCLSEGNCVSLAHWCRLSFKKIMRSYFGERGTTGNSNLSRYFAIDGCSASNLIAIAGGSPASSSGLIVHTSV